MGGLRVSRPLAPVRAGAAPGRSANTSPLSGRFLIVARVVWIIIALAAVSVFIAAVPAEFAQLRVPCPTAACPTGQLPPTGLRALEDLGLSLDSFAAYSVAMDVVFAAVYGAVAALIYWRKSEDRMGLFVSLALLTFGTSTLPVTMATLASRHPLWEVPVAFFHFLGSASFGLFLYLFPEGRFVPRWTRWVALVWIAWQAPRYFFPDWYHDPNGWHALVTMAVWLGALGTAVYSQVHRYRRVSSPVQRQQIKWVVFGISVALAVFLGIVLALSAFAPTLTSPGALLAHLIGYMFVGYLILLLIPVSIGIAMLRHRLFDVDLVINRTLVYGVLTTSVVLLYVLVVGALGAVLQVQGSLIVSLIATGLAAVMFQPLRDRLQRGVNRLMYGERDDPYAVISRLRSRLESTLAPDAVLPAVARTVKEALKLPYVAIQLRRENGFETAAAAGDQVDHPLDVPLVYGGETVGRLILGPRAGDETFGPADRQLLEDLTHQIGVAAHAVQLTDEALRLSADLQHSRERLVAAREEERRRLRRDLHDGLGPQLAGLTMTAEAARDLVSIDPERAKDLLGDLMERAQGAVSDVRSLVYALRPPALDALGLLGALGAHADHHDDGGVRVTVEASEQLRSLP